MQIDLDPMRTGLHYLVEVGLVDDSRRTLQKLLQLLRRNEDRGFLEKAWERMRDRHRPIEEQGSRTDKPMKPQVVAWELSKRLSDTAIVSSDSDTIANWLARQMPVEVSVEQAAKFAESLAKVTLDCSRMGAALTICIL